MIALIYLHGHTCYINFCSYVVIRGLVSDLLLFLIYVIIRMSAITKTTVIECPRIKSNLVQSNGITADINYTRADWSNNIKPIIVKFSKKYNNSLFESL